MQSNNKLELDEAYLKDDNSHKLLEDISADTSFDNRKHQSKGMTNELEADPNVYVYYANSTATQEVYR